MTNRFTDDYRDQAYVMVTGENESRILVPEFLTG